MTVHGAKIWMIAASVGVLGTACTKAEAPATKKTEQPAKAAKNGPKKAADAKKSLHKHMQEHFVKADDIKGAVIAGESLSEEDGLKQELIHGHPVVKSEDAREGPKAFAERRKPNFKAR